MVVVALLLCLFRVMPSDGASFRRGRPVSGGARGGHLGGPGPDGESVLSQSRSLDTFHGCHSRDNVDFEPRENAKVMRRPLPAPGAGLPTRHESSAADLFVVLVGAVHADA